MSRLLVRLLVAFCCITLLTGCALNRSAPSPAVVRPLAADCGIACIKADRDDFLKKLKERRTNNDGKAKPNQRAFNRWSAVGITSGLAGGVTALVLPHENDKKNTATITSLVAGAVTAWLATRKFETQAARYQSCVDAANASINTFETVYSDAFLPTDQEGQKSYLEAKTHITEQLNKVCPE